MKFSNTNVGNPSTFVTLVQVRPGEFYGLKIHFPVVCNGLQWEQAVLPVISDPKWNTRSPLNQRRLCSSNGGQEMAYQIGLALEESFVLAGYGPGPVL